MILMAYAPVRLVKHDAQNIAGRAFGIAPKIPMPAYVPSVEMIPAIFGSFAAQSAQSK